MRPAGGAPCLVPALATCTLLLVMVELSSAAVVTHTYTRVHNNVSIMLYSLSVSVSRQETLASALQSSTLCSEIGETTMG